MAWHGRGMLWHGMVGVWNGMHVAGALQGRGNAWQVWQGKGMVGMGR